MNARAIPRAAVTSSIRLARLPFDVAARALPGGGSNARLAVDRAEAAAEQAAAQREREQALVEADEAARLEAAAERAKEERKED